jgi:hypothetical protein
MIDKTTKEADSQASWLTARQEGFCQAYVRCGNGAEAARRAGYSRRRGRQTARELLRKRDILARVREIRRSAMERAIEVLGAERLKQALSQLVRPTSLADFEPWIRGERTLAELRDEGVPVQLVRRAIVREGRKGRVRRELDLWDQRPIIETLGKFIGALSDGGKTQQYMHVHETLAVLGMSVDDLRTLGPDELRRLEDAGLIRLTHDGEIVGSETDGRKDGESVGERRPS